MRILYVEDDVLMRRVLARYSRRAGCEVAVVGVSTVAECLEQLASEPFDAVLCDFDLGLESTASLVRRLHRWRCPVVVFTSRPERARAEVGGRARVISKLEPIQVVCDALAAAVAAEQRRIDVERSHVASAVDGASRPRSSTAQSG